MAPRLPIHAGPLRTACCLQLHYKRGPSPPGELRKKLNLETTTPELTINEILASHADSEWKTVVFKSTIC